MAPNRSRAALVGCTVPLFALHDAAGQRWLEQWLLYHLESGVDRIRVYDLDGSAGSVVTSAALAGRVEYMPFWPASVMPPGAAEKSKGSNPYCALAAALNHCHFEHRYLADMVVELRSPDEFWEAPGFPGPGGVGRAVAELYLPRLPDLGVLIVPQLPFGPGPEGPAAADEAPAFTRFPYADARGPQEGFVNLLNPRHIYSSHIHGARPRGRLEACGGGEDIPEAHCVLRVQADVLRVRHYTELFGPSSRFECCGPADGALRWASSAVRAGAGQRAARSSGAVSRIRPDVIRDFFELFDADKDALLSEAEVRKAWYLDPEESGEFRYWRLYRLRGLHAQGVRLETPDLAAVVDLFRGWDADGSGALDEGEFAEGLQSGTRRQRPAPAAR